MHQIEFSTQFFGQAFGFAHRQLARRDLVGGRDLGGFVQGQQSARMTHVEITRHQHGLHRLGQIQQAQQVAGGAARTAHSLSGGFVCEPKLFDQALQTLGFFQGVEVFALDVLDQRHGGGGLVGHIAHQDRHRL